MKQHWMPVAVMTYLVLSISWWSVLLFNKNEAFFMAEANLARCQTEDSAMLDNALARIEDKHQRQKGMILGESLFLILSVLAGIYLITRAYRKEFRIARQQQNFLLSITHELRSPLAAIRLSHETLLRPGIDEVKKQQILKGALAEDERLGELIDKLLLAAQMEGSPIFHKTQISLEKWLEKRLEEARRKWPERHFEWEAVPDKAQLHIDESALHSIVMNLLENAVKYSSPEQPVQLALHSGPESVEISVSDRGPGVPDAEKKSVFEKFYRIGSEQTRRSKGTGLGLYISQKLTSAMGGQIRVEDRPGGGAIFKLSFPNLATSE